MNSYFTFFEINLRQIRGYVHGKFSKGFSCSWIFSAFWALTNGRSCFFSNKFSLFSKAAECWKCSELPQIKMWRPWIISVNKKVSQKNHIRSHVFSWWKTSFRAIRFSIKYSFAHFQNGRFEFNVEALFRNSYSNPNSSLEVEVE